MKVKCIDADWTGGELTKDKEYEVLGEIGCYYQLKENDKGAQYQCYVKSRFQIIYKEKEVKEEKEMKEKTFREVIADIKEGEVWSSDYFKIYINSDGDIRISDANEEEFNGVLALIFDKNRKYRLQRKKYTFEEAFKAFKEGKEIESVHHKSRYKKDEQQGMYIKDEYVACAECMISFLEIQDTWYIND